MTKYATLSAAERAMRSIEKKIEKHNDSLANEKNKLNAIKEQIKSLEEKEVVAVVRKYDVSLLELEKLIKGNSGMDFIQKNLFEENSKESTPALVESAYISTVDDKITS